MSIVYLHFNRAKGNGTRKISVSIVEKEHQPKNKDKTK